MGIIERIKHMLTMQKPQAETAGAASLVRVSDFLTEKNILFFPARLDKSFLFKELIATMDLEDPGLAFKEVEYRELWGRTVLAPGLAIPHARLAGLPRIIAALGICQKGTADPATGSRPWIYLLFVGPTQDVKQHLAFLAATSSLFQTKGLVERLSQLSSAESVLAQIRYAEKA